VILYAGQKPGTKTRYFHHDEELLDAHPEFLDGSSPSLDARLDIVKTAVPDLAASASRVAIAEWGRPAADITHLVVTTNSGAHVPGVDFRLVQLLSLSPSVRRSMLYLNGCFAGAAALRLAKDLAENNRGARVLVVSAELSILFFAKPEEGKFQTLVNQGFFGDGSSAVIVGADPVSTVERPLFEIVSAAQTIIPETENALLIHLSSGGLIGSSMHRHLPDLIGGNIKRCLQDSLSPLGLDPKWNELFWVVHPGSVGIMDGIEAALQLKPDKLGASRRVLCDYGNMLSATVVFVLDEMRRRMASAQGEKFEWGVLMSFGPGITVETMVLRATRNYLAQ
jgi:bisdemethoxycurcumin synthase